VNDAFRNPPLSTEQVIHPDRYPNDPPRPVRVPQLVEKLGGPWKDLDVQEVGEEWLRALLELRLPPADASRAAAGWEGGQYRAWQLQDHTAVLMQTLWDGGAQAGEFAAGMRTWLGGQTAELRRKGSEVDVLFGSDSTALEDLARATG
jgi:hypothetical protein